MYKKAYGFTIVELLIVIVVIAILAAISIVAYSGISNSANDSAVQSDISSMAKKIELDAVERGGYLPGGGAVGNITTFPGFTFRPTKSAYLTGTDTNLFYCRGNDSTGKDTFRIVARSKSGQAYSYDPPTGMRSLGNVAVGPTRTCSGLTSTSYSYEYYSNTDTWWPWTNG